MQLPNAENARVDREKVTEYLLNRMHPDGAGKAVFFERLGFCAEQWQVLAEALRQHAEHRVADFVESEYGMRYAVDGAIETPCGRRPWVRSVWIIEKGGRQPRLVTAHPVQKLP